MLKFFNNIAKSSVLLFLIFLLTFLASCGDNKESKKTESKNNASDNQIATEEIIPDEPIVIYKENIL